MRSFFSPQFLHAVNEQKVERIKQDLDDVLLSIRTSFIKLGENLFKARQTLTAEEYDEIMMYVEKQGIRRSDQRASIAAYLFENPHLGGHTDTRIEPKLVFAGAANSKILAMDPEDQERLVTDEEFEVLQPSGRTAAKSWSHMTEQERNTLVGKGGKITTIDEQKDRQNAKSIKPNTALLRGCGIEVTGKKVVIHVKDSPVQVQFETPVLARMLDDEKWEMLAKARQKVQQETGAVAAA